MRRKTLNFNPSHQEGEKEEVYEESLTSLNEINTESDLDLTALESLHISSNDKFILVITDNEDNIIWAIYRKDLAPHEVTICTATSITLLNYLKATDVLQELNGSNLPISGKAIQQAIGVKIKDLTRILSETVDNRYIKVKTDKEGNILHYVLPDGIYCFNKLELPMDVIGEIKAYNKSDLSDLKSIQVSQPSSLCKVHLLNTTIDHLPLDKPKIECFALFIIDGYFFLKKALVSLQGSSSMYYPEKNLAIEILNTDGSSCKVKFGKGIATSKFHLKVNWIDSTHARNICANRLYEEIVKTSPYDNRRPWSTSWGPYNSNMDEQIDTGAMGHIDGFPIEVSFGDNYYGLATMNLTKNRDNYNMSKKTMEKKMQGFAFNSN